MGVTPLAGALVTRADGAWFHAWCNTRVSPTFLFLFALHFALDCGRVAEQSLLTQANLGTTAAETLPTATTFHICELPLCVC